MAARLDIMEDSVKEMIDRADQLSQLASSLEGALLQSLPPSSLHMTRICWEYARWMRFVTI
jgi:hypothetical protein